MKQLFYVFDEHTDFIKVLNKKNRLIILKSEREFLIGNTKYVLLSPHECYSGWTITLMALPCLEYAKLIELIESSNIYDEIVGGIGILLKDYRDSFTNYLLNTRTSKSKKFKKIILKDIIDNSPYVMNMSRLIEACNL